MRMCMRMCMRMYIYSCMYMCRKRACEAKKRGSARAKIR